ncbi:RND family efflux transporter, MFP subunit [Catalinimonas alkaloidigena]|uniref:RND family efflux transporter, MFP subunit n=1 Tax=Catalinimonas alkaloidigena TaxID=1075417 RepID=A0A1G9A3M8_9BACT|nr:efflux RND transporter periplasmic adaptor subunit [Catalinimonas alkaloidigena]SDK21999.1 RND family efflux transporter, MFP subunit [Catalinimonas alkaloidigena]
MKRILTIVALVVVVGLVAFRLINNKEKIDANNQVTEEQTKVAVNVAPVVNRLSEKNLKLVGTVTANQVIDIKSEVQGKITSLNVELGDYVKRGQVIARIDNRLQELSLDNAEQKLADAKQNLQRYKNLYEGGAATKAQLDQNQLAYDNAENQLAQARKQLSNAVVTAPISGYITQKPVEAGAFANLGTSLATIVDVSKLKVQLNVAERDVYALNEGDSVRISTTVYPGVTFHGTITFISPRGDEAHNYPVEISLQNQDKNPLKAGTYVDVAFNRQSQVPSLQIPRDALVGSIKDAQVYVVNNNVVTLKDITVGTDNGNYLEVLSGLQQGEQVVTTGQINLTDSAQVEVINQGAVTSAE